MASAEQLKALLNSHIDGDDERFMTIALQVAAHEARSGHSRLAVEIRDLIDGAKRRRRERLVIPMDRSANGLAGLLELSRPKARLGSMTLAETLAKGIRRIIRESRHAPRILAQGLSPRRKLLLVGPPGTGKTMTASVLAGELGLPLLEVRLDGLITRFMGETAAKLRQIFDSTSSIRGVYLFDEFDAIGPERGFSNDVGEIRRILNSFLQMIERDQSSSIVVAATNHPGMLDRALFRRFDDVLRYELPEEAVIAEMLESSLGESMDPRTGWCTIAARAVGLSHADIARLVNEVLKEALIEGRSRVREMDLVCSLDELKNAAAALTSTPSTL